MKTVRVAGGIVQEIIPDYAKPVDQWYGEAFAAQCHEAPDEVEQGWRYDADTGTFAPPAEPESPTPAPLDALTVTQLAVAELAQTVEDNNTATQLAIAELAEALLGGAT
ncbi:hypothetical protein KL86CLO1_10516 [uncultured Eubacteriales bacterium]|uniref:Uncharacterized protein n=1 Tax=uncultured Eubacteriales bacterium TaxID=172733 RepID=A0A212J4T4_9FIRM|nr:hypothetical protein KL86CLO1_10516 [uncultured Eubacteriales bacterium]